MHAPNTQTYVGTSEHVPNMKHALISKLRLLSQVYGTTCIRAV